MPSSIAASVAGSVAGGLLNKGKSTQTSQTMPVLPPEYQQGFTDLLTRANGIANTPRQEPLMRRVAASTDWKANPQLFAMQQAADQKFKAGLLNPKPEQPKQNTPSLQSGLNALIGQFQNQISQNPGYSLNTNAPGVGDVRSEFMADPMGFMQKLGIDANNPQAYAAVQAALGFKPSGYTG